MVFFCSTQLAGVRAKKKWSEEKEEEFKKGFLFDGNFRELWNWAFA